MNNFNWENNTWKIIEKYLLKDDGSHLVQHQLYSYNEFINKYLPETIYEYNNLHLKYDYQEKFQNYQYELFITFSDISITSAMIHENDGSMLVMKPNDARGRSFTYSADLFINLKIKYIKRDENTGEITFLKENTLEKISLGKIPIMLKSCLCILTKEKNL